VPLYGSASDSAFNVDILRIIDLILSVIAVVLVIIIIIIIISKVAVR